MFKRQGQERAGAAVQDLNITDKETFALMRSAIRGRRRPGWGWGGGRGGDLAARGSRSPGRRKLSSGVELQLVSLTISVR